MSHLRSLILAREAVKNSKGKERFLPKDEYGHWGTDVYHWCHKGWEANNFNDYGWGISNALRPYVEGGDLTRWWMEGRSKQDMLDLLKKGIEGQM